MDKGGISQFENFADKGEGINISRFCADVFMDGPLLSWPTSYIEYQSQLTIVMFILSLAKLTC